MSDNDTQSLLRDPKPKFIWTRRQVYDMITSRIGRAMKRYIDPQETVAKMLYEADLMDEYLENGGAITAKTTKQLHHIERAFHITIYTSYTLNDIESVAEWILEKNGRIDLGSQENATVHVPHPRYYKKNYNK